MINFDFLKTTPDLDTFGDVSILAEKILHIDLDSCAELSQGDVK